MDNDDNFLPAEMQKSDKSVVVYKSDDGILQLEVRVDNDTVWLTQAQIAQLYGVDRTVVVRHIGNIYKTNELVEKSTCAKIAQVQNEGKRTVQREVNYYNLDMIISVGYRVNSLNATRFRQWANEIIKEYILKGYAINLRFERLENRVSKTEEKIDFFVKTSLPPIQGVFCNGQIFDAYSFVSDLVRKARKDIILIDNYVDDSVLKILDKRENGVSATIYTANFSEKLKLDLGKHNSQYSPINIEVSGKSHDRFLILDDEVWHIGASLKDLGKRVFAFSRMEINKEEVLSLIV